MDREPRGFLAEALERSLERSRLQEAPPKPGSLRAAVEHALRSGRPGLILEFKRCTPRGFTAYRTPWEFLEATRGVADAYSVLVEPYWFCGSPELVSFFARHKPVLAKDFTSTPTQLQAYKAAGASAALLILDMTGWQGLDELYTHAAQLGLEVLIETGNARDAVEAMHSYPQALVGINARNLETLELSYERLLTEVKKAAERKPARAILVAESSIDTPDKAAQLAQAGADALLIGTWIIKNPTQAARQLIHQFHRH
ncbi:beta/alpha barrel domain-containing protein [Stetteria hydrogenophila]